MRKTNLFTIVLLFCVVLCICVSKANVSQNLIELQKYQEGNEIVEYDNKSFDIIWTTASLGTRNTIVHYYDITNNKEIDGSTNWDVLANDGDTIILKNRRALTSENELKYNYIGAKIDSIDGESAEEISFSSEEDGWYYYPSNGNKIAWQTKNISEVHVYLLYESQEQKNNLKTVTTEDTSKTINIMAFDYSFTYKDGYVEGINTSNNSQRPFFVAGIGDSEYWFNRWSGSWNEEMIQSHTTSYQTGSKEFIAQNIVDKSLKEGYPVLSQETGYEGESLSYLFDENEVEGKIIYGGNTTTDTLNHLFTKDAEGYYKYNSEENFASLVSSNSNQKDFIVYATPSSEKNKAKFMPFNDLDDNAELIGKGAHGNEDAYNEYFSGYTEGIGNGNFAFGMKLEFDFTQPTDGKDNNNNDITFEIEADDCVWVFIDDILILDLGGIHGTEKTTINFATGEITEGNLKSTLSDKIKVASSDIELDSEGRYLDNSEHNIKIYSLERGGYESTFGIEFNLQLIEHNTYNIETITDGNGTVEADHIEAESGTAVKFTVTPEEGYVLGEVKVTDANGNVLTFTDYTFTMPSSDVKIEVIFKKITNDGDVINPNTVGKLIGIIGIGFIISLGTLSLYYKKIKL